ncbi:MAG: family 16 glycoside hydrolase [Candidatus Eisenbacteria bacterium]
MSVKNFRGTRTPALLATLLLLGASGRVDEARLASPPRSPRFAPPTSGVLLAEDFSAMAIARSWHPDREGVWTVSRGMLRADLPDVKQLRSLIRAGDSTWTDYAVDIDVCMMRGVDKGVIVRLEGESGIGVDLRSGSYQDVVMYLREWPMGKAQATNANGAWNHLRVEIRSNRVRVSVNGEIRLERHDRRNARPRGGIALPAYTGGVGQCTTYYDNVVVTRLD